ncbi:uncharacterized protein LOC108741631 [Agrilus planipennis]|uniref:Uncharacterized protein LOC108741631 n=1 Tax=Agrilus planipennis TaxID=224129 RepID=A0A1W4XGT0_AGRPL|nr:uncharacterized protein LOC108741631 [Agrilus planipennis]
MSFNSSYEEYYDASSQLFQDERHGPEDEDRQWDSGGFPPRKSTTFSKKLPEVPTIYNRSSTKFRDGFPNAHPYTRPKGRRKMPEIPTRRCNSKQSTINDYSGFGEQGYSTRRGASLPPTPTKAPKLLPRIENGTKPFNSLPGTPGRKLPQPNLKNRRTRLQTKSSSVDNYYEDGYYDDNTIIKIDTVESKEPVYNEDYNYAYQSMDNLPDQQQGVTLTEYYENETDTKKFGGYVEDVQPAVNYGQSNYDTTNSRDYYEDTYGYGKGVKTAQYQEDSVYQNEVETIASSHEKPVSNAYTFTPIRTEGNDFYTDVKTTKTPLITTTSSVNTTGLSSTSQYPWDQSYQTEAIVSTPEKSIGSRLSNFIHPQPTSYHHTTAAATVSSVAPTYTTTSYSTPSAVSTVSDYVTVTATNVPTSHHQTRGMLKQQQSIDSTYQQDDYDKQDRQESIESYEETEEDLETKELHQDEYLPEYQQQQQQRQAIMAKESQSPASVIYNEDDEQSLRRGSSQITVVDPYHILSQRAAADSLVTNSRRSSADPRFAEKAQPVVDKYPQDGAAASIDDQFGVDANRTATSSLEAVYPTDLTRRASVRQSPAMNVTEPKDIIENEVVHEEELDHFEEHHEEPEPARPKVTAQQRWLWAYNKIIMQLNRRT